MTAGQNDAIYGDHPPPSCAEDTVTVSVWVCASVIACSMPVFAQPSPDAHDGQHDFDFELGSWTAHIKRLVHPLSGNATWVELDGTSVVRQVWNGRANLGELEVTGGSSKIEGLSLRTYKPQSHQWSIHWANSHDGTVGAPMIGQFNATRGEFYDQESFDGRAIFVRFIFSDVSPATFRLEQAFSDDGGKTCEPNWIATFKRARNAEPAAGTKR